MRVRVAQPGLAAAVLRRAGQGAAAGRAYRPARRGPADEPGLAGRPLGLLRPGRTPHRRAAVRRRRLSLLAPLGCLSAAATRHARRAAGRRVRRRRPAAPVRGDHPTVDWNQDMTSTTATTTATALVARTELLPEGVDLRTESGDTGLLFCREGSGLAGLGCALRIELPDGLGSASVAELVAEALAGIQVEDSLGLPGSGPLAVGALPFDRSAPGALVVPAVTFGRAVDGTAWRTTIGAGSVDSASAASVAVSGRRPPDGFSLTSSMPHARWCEVVAD